jgi:hypothetical protein
MTHSVAAVSSRGRGCEDPIMGLRRGGLEGTAAGDADKGPKTSPCYHDEGGGPHARRPPYSLTVSSGRQSLGRRPVRTNSTSRHRNSRGYEGRVLPRCLFIIVGPPERAEFATN